MFVSETGGWVSGGRIVGEWTTSCYQLGASRLPKPTNYYIPIPKPCFKSTLHIPYVSNLCLHFVRDRQWLVAILLANSKPKVVLWPLTRRSSLVINKQPNCLIAPTIIYSYPFQCFKLRALLHNTLLCHFIKLWIHVIYHPGAFVHVFPKNLINFSCHFLK